MQDGDVAYLYTRTQNAPPVFPLPPSIGIGTQPQQPTSRPSPAAQRHNCPAAPQRSPSGYCLCPAHTATIILQAILHNNHPTQQKYNFVPFKSQK